MSLCMLIMIGGDVTVIMIMIGGDVTVHDDDDDYNDRRRCLCA